MGFFDHDGLAGGGKAGGSSLVSSSSFLTTGFFVIHDGFPEEEGRAGGDSSLSFPGGVFRHDLVAGEEEEEVLSMVLGEDFLAHAGLLCSASFVDGFPGSEGCCGFCGIGDLFPG